MAVFHILLLFVSVHACYPSQLNSEFALFYNGITNTDCKENSVFTKKLQAHKYMTVYSCHDTEDVQGDKTCYTVWTSICFQNTVTFNK